MGNPPGHRLSRERADEIITGVPAEMVSVTRQPPAGPELAQPPLTEGHVAAVRLLEQVDALRATAGMYREALGHDVYFRPTDKGLTVIALDPSALAMVGVGTLRAWLPARGDLEHQLTGYREKRAQMRRNSAEERASVRLVAHALTNRLRLPDGLLFVCQEWRFPLVGAGSGKLDLLAVDPARRALVVIELKSTATSRGRSGTPSEQAERYAGWLHDGRRLFSPFFGRLLRAMAAAYGGSPEAFTLVLDEAARPGTRVLHAGEVT